MSAGPFSVVTYGLDTANGGGTALVRVQPETLAASIAGSPNASPGGSATLPVFAKVNKGIREYGIGCRSVTLSFTGSPPDGYSGDPVTIPVLDETVYADWQVATTGTYLGAPVIVIARSPERVR